MTKPKINFNNLPYSDSFSDIDKNKTIFQIGNTDYYEDVFENTNDYTYIETICELIPKSSFNNVKASIKYRNKVNDSINKIAKYNLYDNSIISMDNVVSSIDIVLNDIINMKNNINNSIVYTKNFEKQDKDIILTTIEEENKSGINTTSYAYYFGGSFMQQYLFYIKHDYNKDPYISLISSEDIINNTCNIKLDPNINMADLKTLQDDIMDGKIKININNKKYKSLFYKKHTLISNKINIMFKELHN